MKALEHNTATSIWRISMHRIFELVDGLYHRTFFSSRRAFWDEVRSVTSWDQVLVRMNSPPQPLPPQDR